MARLNFTLYVDSSFPRKLWRNDIQRLTKICGELNVGHYSIDIVHFAKERQRAFHDGVVKAPTILLEEESGRKRILGDMAETEEFLKLMTLTLRPELNKSSLLKSLLSNVRWLKESSRELAS